MIVIHVETANRWRPLRMLQLSPAVAVFPTASRLQSQPAVSPQLSLGTKTMWRLQQRDQQGNPYRAQSWDLAENLTGRMLPAFLQQLLPRLSTDLY